MSYNKSIRHRRSRTPHQPAFRLAIMPAMLTAALGYANSAGAVEGGVVAAGSGTIATQGAKTTINQASDRMVVNWNDFNIARDQSVAFNQPSATSAVLNRVTTAAPTQIDGALTANGRVFVVNPSGVMFGKTSQVNVGSLVASTLNVDSQKFMDGGEPVTGIMNLSANGAQGVVSNDGQINAREAVVLLGAQATNQGTIRAKDVTLGAADGVAMQMNGSGFKVMLGREAQNALAANSGVITANGGNVQLNAAATGAMLATVVRNSGTLEATRATTGEGGSIILGSQLDGNVSAGGRINAATDITIGSAPVSYPPYLSPFNADTAPSGGAYGSAGHNVTVEKGAFLTTSQGAVKIGTGGGDVVSNGRISSAGDVQIGAGGTGAVTVNEAINGRSVAVQGTGVDINSWMTASSGDLSIKADGSGAGNLNQNANLEATKGSVNLTGTNITQKKGVNTYAGDAMNIGASGAIQAARLNAQGDVRIGAAGPIAVNDAINGRSVSMQGTGVDVNSWINATKGDVSIKADGPMPGGQGDLNQNADVKAFNGAVNLTGTNVTQKLGSVTYAGGNGVNTATSGVKIGATNALQVARVDSVGDVQLGAAGPVKVVDGVNGSSVSMQGTGVDVNSWITATKGDVSIKADGLGKGDLNQNANVTSNQGSVNLTGTNITQKRGIGTYANNGVNIGATGALQAARVSANGDVQIGAAGPIAVNDAINGRSVAMQGTGVDLNSWINASTGDVSIKADALGQGDLNQNGEVKAFKGAVNLTGTNVTQKGYVTYAANGVNIGATGALQTARIDTAGDVNLGAAGPIKVTDGINGSSVAMQGTGVDVNSWITATKGDVSIKADGPVPGGQGDLNQNADVKAFNGAVNLTGTNVTQKLGSVTYAGGNGVNTATSGVKIGATNALQVARVDSVGDVQLGAAGPVKVVDGVNGSSVSMQGTGVDLNSWITATKGDVSIKADGLGKGDLNQNANVTSNQGSVNLTGTNITQKRGIGTYANNGVNIGATGALQAARVSANGDVQIGAAGPIAVNDAINGRSVAMQGTGVDLNSWINASTGDVSIKADALGQGDLNQNGEVKAFKGAVNLTGTNVTQKGYVTYAANGVNIGATGALQTARIDTAGDVNLGAAGPIKVTDGINGSSVAMQGTGVDVNSWITATKGDVSIKADGPAPGGQGDLNQNANVTSNQGSVNLTGTNITQKKGVTTNANNAVNIGASDALVAARVIAGGDIKMGSLGDGELAVTGEVTGASVAMQGTGVEITAPITATKGDVSIQSFNTKLGDLTQFANVTANKGSVNLIGGNVIQTSGVNTVAGQDVNIAAAGELRAQRVSAGGDVTLAAVGDGALTTNSEVRGGSVTMTGSGVNINGQVTATKGDVQVQADGALPGNLKQYANVTANQGSVYLAGSSVVQDFGVSTTAGQDVKIGTSGTLQAGLLNGKTVSLEGDRVFLVRDVNAEGDIVVHSTNSLCYPGTGCSDNWKGIFQLGNVTSRKGGIMMAVDPGVSFDPQTGLPVSYTGTIGQYASSQTRAATEISLRAVGVSAASNTAGQKITVEALGYQQTGGKLTAPEIVLPTPITVSDNGSGR
ncbi:beta strand repeat-containing protein [Paraburkholderia sacchari]|uniref:beta strand repeat-containing protein n=1 Tax=Paraburkholderia sacchari TaxID=159450 RepID=UPI001BCE410E|nr:filamentous hemagglutinin N-terminal domain-containing protein [Paraburkholderia sacchari]